jgi:hypothetical protein
LESFYMTILFSRFNTGASVRRLPLALMLGVLVCLSGCSSKGKIKSKVSGTVTYKGKNVEGDIVCVDSSGKEQMPYPIRDGAYSLVDLPKGTYTILVKPAIKSGGMGAPPPEGGPVKSTDSVGAKMGQTTGVAPPPKAGKPNNGIAPLEVTGGDQEFNITLTD